MVLINAVLPFFGILLGLVILHELGHFVVAKLAGVRVEEFGIGMPPRAWGIRFGETLYSINWLPLGGFVRLTGEESANVLVEAVNDDSLAHRAGIQPRDVVVSVNDEPVHNAEQFAAHLRHALHDGSIRLVVQREEHSRHGSELTEYDVSLPVAPLGGDPSGPSAPAKPNEPAESIEATIGRIAGVQVVPDHRSLGTKARPVRIAVMAAGATVNAILPIFLFALAALIPQNQPAGPAMITSIVSGGPAQQAGLLPGDRIIEINGTTITNTNDVSREINLALGSNIEFVVKRLVGDVVTSQTTTPTDYQRISTVVHARLAPQPHRHVSHPGETVLDVADALAVNVTVVQDTVFGFGLDLPEGITLTFDDGKTYITQKDDTVLGLSGELLRRQQQIISASGLDFHNLEPGTVVEIPQGPTGIRITNGSSNLERSGEGVFAAVGSGWERTVDTLYLLRNRIRSWIAGGEGLEFSGPIGIARTTGEVVEQAGWLRLIELAALLSINLAIINILPLPMLDGGRIMFVLLEIVRRGKRISPEKEGLVHMTGFALLITFVIVVSYFDIIKAISGESTLR